MVSVEDPYRPKTGDEIKQTIEEGLSSLARQVIRLGAPNIAYQLSPNGQMLSFLVGTDLGAADPTLSRAGDAAELAANFLLGDAKYFGLEPEWLRSHLYRKTVLESRMGKHIVFGLMVRDIEIENQSFVVHLDRKNRVVMVTGLYEAGAVQRLLARPSVIQSRDKVNKIVSGVLQKAINCKVQVESYRVEWHSIPTCNGQKTEFHDGIQLKITTSTRDVYTVYAYEDETTKNIEIVNVFPIGSASNRGVMSTAQIYDGFLQLALNRRTNTGVGEAAHAAEPNGRRGDTSPARMVLEIESNFLERPLRPVILRDLEDASTLVGRYARVSDAVNAIENTAVSVDVEPDESNTLFDRVMAYYHLDLVQRYFRELGMSVLDCPDCAQFNPMVVVLDPIVDTNKFVPTELKIHIKRLFPKREGNESDTTDFMFTGALEPRTVYHEFVHAVTDALARLQRGGKSRLSCLYLREALQASAMDEGLADYFACSLAAQHGAPRAFFYVLGTTDVEGEQKLCLITHRQLDVTPRSKQYKRDARKVSEAIQNFKLEATGGLESAVQPDCSAWEVRAINEESIENNTAELWNAPYEWGEVWSRYLWQLRVALGVQVADTLIAHSIFFLTRWATFSQGVIALVVADYLLFGKEDPAEDDNRIRRYEPILGAKHEQTILNLRPLPDHSVWNNWQRGKTEGRTSSTVSSDHARGLSSIRKEA